MQVVPASADRAHMCIHGCELDCVYVCFLISFTKDGGNAHTNRANGPLSDPTSLSKIARNVTAPLARIPCPRIRQTVKRLQPGIILVMRVTGKPPLLLPPPSSRLRPCLAWMKKARLFLSLCLLLGSHSLYSPPLPSSEEEPPEEEEDEEEEPRGNSSRLSLGPRGLFSTMPLEPRKQTSQVTSISCSGGRIWLLDIRTRIILTTSISYLPYSYNRVL